MTVKQLLDVIPDDRYVGIDINGTVNIFKAFEWECEKGLNYVCNRTVVEVTSEYEEYLDGENKTFIQIIMQ